jgi:hypothetical protein
MKKTLLLTVLFALLTTLGFSQIDNLWSSHNGSRTTIITDKAVARLSFPKEFKLYDLNIAPLRQQLMSIAGSQALRHSAIISFPNADGQLEQFEVMEASNFEPALQTLFPQIRAFSGKGITDKYATLKLSISPQGIQTIVFRTDKENECIEAYSVDHSIYAVFKSQRVIGQLPWSCSTDEKKSLNEMSSKVTEANFTTSSAGELRTMRLAQSVTAEYSNYFGAFSAAQVGLVLAAINATLTRCNGVYEKDLALHLNLIANTTDVIYYDPATDPYSPAASGAGGAWNGELQANLTSVIGAANYDIGHLFGASGGGGNAGCIGCVCGTGKGSGFTSPADAIPAGDNFDIDYVVHEVGHQLGANHTFSMSLEGTGVNKEVGSGITIMGYAGITSQDVAPHSIDIFHEASIQQIQVNLAGKTCPITTNITANNATPVVAPVSNYTIPLSTPFELTGSASDANAGDALTYCWEQNDNSTTTGNASVASPTKLTGPNWLSFSPTASPSRTFPKLSTILAGLFVTPTLPGGDAVANIEALSSVARNLNFRLTVRDNSPYVSSGAGIKVGQTAFTDMIVTVAALGPFAVTVPNTNVSWEATTTQTVTWSVNGTTGAPVSCSDVKILLSTDGGLTFPTVLVASTPNDGTEAVVIPNTPSTTARIKVQSIGNIFFDISNTNFTIAVPTSGFDFTSPAATTIACNAPATADVTLGTTSIGGYVVPVALTATAGVPAGTSISFAPASVIPGNSSIVTLNNANTLAAGTYNITITGISGVITKTRVISYIVSPGTAPTIVTAPASISVCSGSNALFSVSTSGAAVTSYQWQSSPDGVTYSNIVGATAATYTATAVTTALNNYRYRVIVNGQCGSVTTVAAVLTVQTAPAITTQPVNAVECVGNNAVFTSAATGTGLTYQWQVSIDGGTSFSDIGGATSSTYTVTGVILSQNNYRYRVIVSGTCPAPVTSNAAILSVGNAAAISTQPISTTVCVGQTANFTVAATGSSLTYQWQQSIDGGVTFTNITGATSAALSLPAVVATMTGYQYHVNVYSCVPTPIISSTVTLTVNTLIAINTQPVAVVLCEAANASFTVAAVGTGAAYQWQVSTTGCAGTFANIAGATSNTLAVNSVIASQNGYAYRVVITGTCNTVTSSCAALTVNNPIVITTQPSSTSACLPTTTTASFSVAVTGTAPTYQWQLSTNAGTTWTNIAAATTNTLGLTGLTASMTGYQYRVVLNGTCTAGLNSNAATLTVNTLVAITSQPVSKSICANAATTFDVAATGSTITYQWEVSVNGGPYVALTNAAPYAGVTTTSLSVTNAGTVLNGNKYRVIVSGVPCGSVTSSVATLTVNPLPSAVLVAAEYSRLTPYINSNLYTTVSPVGTYTYQWYKNNFLVSGASASSLPVTIDGFGDYTVIVRDANGCTASTNRVTISDSISNRVFVYPNPNKGQFQVRYYSPNASSTGYTVSVYDSKGAIVFSKLFPIARTYDRMDINLKNVQAGTYMLEVRDAQGKRLASSSVIVL